MRISLNRDLSKFYPLNPAFILIFASIFISACYPLDRVLHKGSVRALASCIDASTNVSGVLSDDAIRRNCIDENHISLPRPLISEMNGGLTLDYLNYARRFSVTQFSLSNIPENFVVTEVNLLIFIYNDSGERLEVPQKRREWIEGPINNHVVNLNRQDPWFVPMPDGLVFPEDVSFGWCGQSGPRRNCYTWNISGVKGLQY